MTGSLYHSNITGFLSSGNVVMGENKCNLHHVIYQQISGFEGCSWLGKLKKRSCQNLQIDIFNFLYLSPSVLFYYYYLLFIKLNLKKLIKVPCLAPLSFFS